MMAKEKWAEEARKAVESCTLSPEEIGEKIYDEVLNDDENFGEVGEQLLSDLRTMSPEQLEGAEKVLIAVTGYSIPSLLS